MPPWFFIKQKDFNRLWQKIEFLVNIKDALFFGRDFLLTGSCVEDYCPVPPYELQMPGHDIMHNHVFLKEAQIMLENILSISHEQIFFQYSDELSRENFLEYKKILKERHKGKPLYYILKKKFFYKTEFFIDERALIPRNETEILVEKALKLCSKSNIKNVIDLGTGSGCIGLSILKEKRDIRLLAVDCSQEALDLAKTNSRLLGLTHHQIEFLCQSVETLNTELLKNFFKSSYADLIVANPPYIGAKDFIGFSTYHYEPHQALFSGECGLEHVFLWLDKAISLLKQGGYYLFECGDNQALQIKKYLTNRNISHEVVKDYQSIERIFIIQKARL